MARVCQNPYAHRRSNKEGPGEHKSKGPILRTLPSLSDRASKAPKMRAIILPYLFQRVDQGVWVLQPMQHANVRGGSRANALRRGDAGIAEDDPN